MNRILEILNMLKGQAYEDLDRGLMEDEEDIENRITLILEAIEIIDNN